MSHVLGLDYGERRMGFAVSVPGAGLAVPLRTVAVDGERAAVEAVRQLCAETGAERIVLGLPLNMNGSKGPMADKVQRFAERLRGTIGLPVELFDERLSTGLVERALLDADLSRRKRKRVRDKLAAQVILQGYLDSRQAGHDVEDDDLSP